jgi:hypothetical protein
MPVRAGCKLDRDPYIQISRGESGYVHPIPALIAESAAQAARCRTRAWGLRPAGTLFGSSASGIRISRYSSGACRSRSQWPCAEDEAERWSSATQAYAGHLQTRCRPRADSYGQPGSREKPPRVNVAGNVAAKSGAGCSRLSPARRHIYNCSGWKVDLGPIWARSRGGQDLCLSSGRRACGAC